MLRLVIVMLLACAVFAAPGPYMSVQAQVLDEDDGEDRQNANALRSIVTEQYLITVGDRLQVTVIEDSSLNSSHLVRPDGRISMPLAGTVMAAGRTPEAVQATIRARLSDDFVQPPTVTVAVTGVTAFSGPGGGQGIERGTIFLIGQIGRQGRLQFPLNEPLTILEALSLAGGPGVFAATTRIQIRRRTEDGGQIIELFNYDDILAGNALPDHAPLADGDMIVVPERGLFD